MVEILAPKKRDLISTIGWGLLESSPALRGVQGNIPSSLELQELGHNIKDKGLVVK